MKKILISLAVLVCAAYAANAQTLIVVEEKPVLTNKKGVRILPQAGDVGIGISANPFLTYFGNFFNRDGNTAPVFGSQNAMMYGKFFTADNQAIRLGVSLNFYNQYYHGAVRSNADPAINVQDQMKNVTQGFGVNIGYEWRAGRGRLQGFYGVQAFVNYSRVKTTYSYGNEMNSNFPYPWSYNFETNTEVQMTSRLLENAGAPALNVGLQGFVGVEYFFAPKMSVGGELTLGAGWSNQGNSKVKSQYYDQQTNRVVEQHSESRDVNAPTDGLSIRTMTQGNIFLTFYF